MQDTTRNRNSILDEAVRVIEQVVPPKISGSMEPPLTENPVYDLDG
jgi:hypothetical protein